MIGKNDQFFQEYYQKIIDQYKNKGMVVKEFEGLHDIERETLLQLAKEISEKIKRN